MGCQTRGAASRRGGRPPAGRAPPLLPCCPWGRGLRGARGARVEIAHAERLLPDGRLDNANYRAADCRDVYYLKGEGEEIYAPTFTYHGFQYADIRTEGEVSLLNVSVCYLRSDVAPAGTFACSSETLNDLHRIAVQTEGNNLNGTFTDCPQRDERLGWLNDISSRIYQSVCNFALDGYLANFIDMITAEQSEEGVIPDTVPFEVGSTKADVISAYTVLGLIHWRFYKDKEVLRRNYAGFRKWVAYLKADADRNGGTVGHAIYGDWCPALIYAVSRERDTFSAFVEPRFMSAAYYLWYLLQMGEIARILGYAEDAAQYARDYAHDKAKFDEVYFHPETGMYGSGSQTECAGAGRKRRYRRPRVSHDLRQPGLPAFILQFSRVRLCRNTGFPFGKSRISRLGLHAETGRHVGMGTLGRFGGKRHAFLQSPDVHRV